MIKAIATNSCIYKEEELFRVRNAFCEKYIPFLENIERDERIQKWCKNYSAYDSVSDEFGICKTAAELNRDGYVCGIVIRNYRDVVKTAEKEMIYCPTQEYVSSLSYDEILGIISYLYRSDHFVEGDLIRHSIAGGYLRLLFRALTHKNTSDS